MTAQKQSPISTPDRQMAVPQADATVALTARRTKSVAGATILSRLLGIVREQVIAYYFGAGAAVDAFVAAFRIPNLLRDFFAEGAFSAAFVPTFTARLKSEGPQAAFGLLNRMLTVFAVVLALVCLIGILITPQIAWIFASGAERDPAKFTLLVKMARLMFPFLLLISVAAAMMGALNALGRFGIPALAPAGFNVGMIGAAVLFSDQFDPPILALAWGVLAGGLLQWLIQAILLHRMGHRYQWKSAFSHPDVRKVAALMLPAAIGAAAVQINVLAITRFAWTLGDGPVAYLNYAFRILFVPLGVFAVATATVGLPRLSELVASGNEEETRNVFTRGLRTVFFLVVPTAIAFVLLGERICAALYQRGAFDSADTLNTARALSYYSIGLPAMAAIRVTAPLFYAHSDTRTPTLCGVVSVVLNLIGMSVLVGSLGFAGLALSVAGSSIIQVVLLIVLAHRRFGSLRLIPVVGHLVMFAAIGWLSVRVGIRLMDWIIAESIPLGGIGITLLGIGVAVLVYLLVTWLFGYRHLGSTGSFRRT